MELKGHTSTIWCLIEWNKFLISGSYDNTIRIWDRNGNCQRILKEHSDTVSCLLIWRNNLISGSYDKRIIIWNINGDCLMKLTEHTAGILSLAIFNDNLVSGSNDKTIRIWSKEGKCIQILNGHTRGISTLLEWNEYLISADWNNVIRVWNKNGICLQEVKENGGSRLTKWKGKLVCGSYSNRNLPIWKYGLELWNTENHLLFPSLMKNQILTIMILSIKNSVNGNSYYPQSNLSRLPKDILFIIFQFLTMEETKYG